jgi:hypothetical protein
VAEGKPEYTEMVNASKKLPCSVPTEPMASTLLPVTADGWLPSWATAYHALLLCFGAMGFTRSGVLRVSTSSAALLLLSLVPLASGACVDGDLGFGGALAALGIMDESCGTVIPAVRA